MKHTMRVTADCQLSTLVHTNLDHGWFRIHDVLDSLDDLEGILAMNFLAVLEPLDHIIDELLRHFLLQSHTIIAVVNCYGDDI